jgi:subtilisin-like proprotein convertase family protein
MEVFLMRSLFGRHLGLAGLAAGTLAASAALAFAKEIAIDEITITANGSRSGAAAATPWSGVWWPFVDLELARGWNGTGADFSYDETAKRWNRQNASKPVNDRSPLLKYDEYVRLTTGSDPQSALLECTGDDAKDFSHSVYGDKKKQYDDEGISYSWWGHCNGWCGAALMEKEPIGPIEARGIRFDVADLKGLLAESFWGVESDFTGKRYNLPPKNIRETREPQKTLLAALESGNPRPVAEYIAWYEKAWNTTMSEAAKAAAKPEDFRDELITYRDWYERTYEAAYKDLAPNVFHRILETVIGRKKLALVFDITANEEVWNHPAYQYETNFSLLRSFTENGASLKEWSVTTIVHYATDGVSESILGISAFTKTYTYKLVTDASGKIVRGEWTGASVDDHPDFAWLPTYNPTGADYGENYKLLYGKILEILPAAHAAGEARAIDLAVNGTPASTRRPSDRTTTWTNPVPASGELALSVSVASGRSVAKVKYYEQAISGSTNPTATRTPLTALGESTAAPVFGVTARLTSNGKKMLLAYAFDGSGRLLGVDEIAVQYTTSGSGGGTACADDSFDVNDSRATAKPIAAGSYSGLMCNDDDWYKIELASAGSISVRIDFTHSAGDLDMTLEGPSGMIAKSEGTSNQESVAGSNLPAGVYFVHVYGYNGARGGYAMTVNVTGSTGGGAATGGDDSFEENDSRSAARALAAGSYPGLQCKDDDWYAITLLSAGSLTVRIDFTHSAGDLDMVLEDASGNAIARSESTSDSETVTKSGLAAGTYYVHVYGYQGAQGAYSMTVSTTSSGDTATARTGTVTAATLNVRSGPGTSYSIVRTLSSGTRVTVHETSGMWYRVTWSGAGSGPYWVYKTYVRLD